MTIVSADTNVCITVVENLVAFDAVIAATAAINVNIADVSAIVVVFATAFSVCSSCFAYND